jgi:CPA1 family monovalent cation:H+ antiporter
VTGRTIPTITLVLLACVLLVWGTPGSLVTAQTSHPALHGEGDVVRPVIGVLELLLLASLSAVALRRLRFPYTIGLVLVGVLLAVAQDHLDFLQPMRLIRLTPEVVLYLFIPTLIFPAAVRLDPPLLKQNAVPILLLALPGLILSTLIVGGVVRAVTPLAWGSALLFGALISATDPVAVVALFGELKVPGRLANAVEGESLFNDAAAMVLFTGILSAIDSDAPGPVLLAQGAASFVWTALGGFGVGAIAAALYAALVRTAEDDPLVEIALSMVLAYTVFAVAQYHLGVSGILAVAGAGLVARRLRRRDFEGTTRAQPYLQHFWSYAEFVANSFIFLFLGIGADTFLNRLRGANLADLSYILWAVVAVIVARFVVVYGVIGVFNRCTKGERFDWRYQAVIFWSGGMRGALPLVLVLSLPASFAQRQLVLDMTVGVVLFTLLVAGTTSSRLVRSVR